MPYTTITSPSLLSRKTTTTDIEEGGARPIYPELPTYTPPSVDTGRIGLLTQQAAAPALRRERFGLIQGLQSAAAEGERRGNPLAGLLRRQVLEAHGQGVSDIFGRARGEAMSMYAPEYGAEVEAERSRIESARDKAAAEYAFQVRDYLRRKEEERTEELRGAAPKHTVSYLRSGGSSGGGYGGGGGYRYPSTTASTSTVVNPKYWSSYEDQQRGMTMSEATGRPLSDFYTGPGYQEARDATFISDFSL